MKIRPTSKYIFYAAVCLTLVRISCPDTVASGLLSANNPNGRYFSDPSGKAVFLTGSHTWNNFQDGGWRAADFVNPGTFDYEGYLRWMEDNNQNFIRLWTPENYLDFQCSTATNCTPFDEQNPVTPTLYERDSSTCQSNCNGNDGMRKFDLSRLNERYFTQLRERIELAAQHGIYVSIMLFDAWGIGVYQRSSPVTSPLMPGGRVIHTIRPTTSMA